jgi:hypothetical protein
MYVQLYVKIVRKKLLRQAGGRGKAGRRCWQSFPNLWGGGNNSETSFFQKLPWLGSFEFRLFSYRSSRIQFIPTYVCDILLIIFGAIGRSQVQKGHEGRKEKTFRKWRCYQVGGGEGCGDERRGVKSLPEPLLGVSAPLSGLLLPFQAVRLPPILPTKRAAIFEGSGLGKKAM